MRSSAERLLPVHCLLTAGHKTLVVVSFPKKFQTRIAFFDSDTDIFFLSIFFRFDVEAREKKRWEASRWDEAQKES